MININNTQTMSDLLYTIAIILVLLWAVAFFVYSLGSIAHILLVSAIIAILFRLIKRNEI